MNNDPNNHPLPGNFLGTIYKGGFIVPVIQTLLLTVIALSIERYIANTLCKTKCSFFFLSKKAIFSVFLNIDLTIEFLFRSHIDTHREKNINLSPIENN